MTEFIQGGVCAAQGFRASGVHCGIRKNKTKKDLALIVSDCRASAAAVYTQNLVKGAPLLVTMQNVADGYAQAVICNSGNANTCNAGGQALALEMCTLVQEHTGVAASDVIVASTGVIGQPLNLAPIAAGMPALADGLSRDGTAAALAIMTTDTVEKEVAVAFTAAGKRCSLGGIAKGSGMIHPNMATMLCFLTTDAAISPAMLQQALSTVVPESFNMMSVDGDTSTNDMVTVLANGRAGNAEIATEDADYAVFLEALRTVCIALCRKLAADGEGATKLLECTVGGAADIPTARAAARAVISSSLVKSAMFGADANCGRVLCAIGYGTTTVDVNRIDVTLRSAKGEILVCENGCGLAFDEEKAKAILLEKEIQIAVDLHSGSAAATAWGCDLTYDYVKINGDYRT